MQREEATTESAIEALYNFTRTHILEVHCNRPVPRPTGPVCVGKDTGRDWEKCKDSSPVAAQAAF